MPDILDTIDGALFDFETSKDAMRWQPPEDRDDVKPDAPSPVGPGPRVEWTHLGAVTSPVEIHIDAEAFNEALRQAAEQVNQLVTAFSRAVAPGIYSIAKTLRQVSGAYEAIESARQARLSAMHSEYARRSKARQRRKHGR